MLLSRYPLSLILIGIVSTIACAWSPLQAAATLVLWLGVTFAGRGRWMLNLIG